MILFCEIIMWQCIMLDLSCCLLSRMLYWQCFLEKAMPFKVGLTINLLSPLQVKSFFSFLCPLFFLTLSLDSQLPSQSCILPTLHTDKLYNATPLFVCSAVQKYSSDVLYVCHLFLWYFPVLVPPSLSSILIHIAKVYDIVVINTNHIISQATVFEVEPSVEPMGRF